MLGYHVQRKNPQGVQNKKCPIAESFVLAICPSCFGQCDVADVYLRDCLSGKFRIHLQMALVAALRILARISCFCF